MPSPGESISEVRIAQWLVENGDVVEKDQPIAEIDSDKATLELTSEEEGRSPCSWNPTPAAVGDVVAKVHEREGRRRKASAKASADAEAPEEGGSSAQGEGGRPASRQGKAPAVEAHATPVAKAVMAEKGVDAGQVKGSGPNGRITKSDVEAYLAGGMQAPTLMNGWGGTREESRKKMTTLRRRWASAW